MVKTFRGQIVGFFFFRLILVKKFGVLSDQLSGSLDLVAKSADPRCEPTQFVVVEVFWKLKWMP
jgi:hypothetical protein